MRCTFDERDRFGRAVALCSCCAFTAAHDAGTIGIQVGNSESYPAGTSSTPSRLRWLTSKTPWTGSSVRRGSSYVTDSNLQAAGDVQNRVKDGYLPEGVNGLAVAASREAFLSGDGPFYIGTSYLMSAFSAGLGEDLGAFVLPRKDAGGDPIATGTAGDQFGISTASEHADLAAFFLNFMQGSDFAPRRSHLVRGPCGRGDVVISCR